MLYKHKLLVSEEGAKISCAKERVESALWAGQGMSRGRGKGLAAQRHQEPEEESRKEPGNVCYRKVHLKLARMKY